jgi:hypothetical protein
VIVMLNGEVVERLPADRLPDGATDPPLLAAALGLDAEARPRLAILRRF